MKERDDSVYLKHILDAITRIEDQTNLSEEKRHEKRY